MIIKLTWKESDMPAPIEGLKPVLDELKSKVEKLKSLDQKTEILELSAFHRQVVKDITSAGSQVAAIIEDYNTGDERNFVQELEDIVSDEYFFSAYWDDTVEVFYRYCVNEIREIEKILSKRGIKMKEPAQ